MTQDETTQPGLPQTYFYQPQPTNTLGVAGFVVSLSGMIICLGLTSPIGLILSLIALAKAPRGYAIAGSILGLLGSGLGATSILVFTGVIGDGLFNYASVQHSNPTDDAMTAASWEIDEHFQANQDTLPDQLTADAITAAHTDEWGTTLQYAPATGSTTSYNLTSAGPDVIFGTSDDITQFYAPQTGTEAAMDSASYNIDDYLENSGDRMPTAEEGTGLIVAHTDSWGTALRFAPIPGTNDYYHFISAGPDGAFETDDDIVQQFEAYGFASSVTLPTFPPDLPVVQESQIDAAFDLAAYQIAAAFPPGTALPTEQQVSEQRPVLLDAWRTPMLYRPTDNPPYYHLKSAGPDRQWDTYDDITRSFYFAPAGEISSPDQAPSSTP